jgi:competence ComEA-like helix-hairpin-helix protein
MPLTPSERRGAAWLALLFLIGAGYDAWRTLWPRRPAPAPVSIPQAPAAPVHPAAAPEPVSATVVPLDLNRATVAELEALPGIGPVLARRVAEHRERHGPFRSLDELSAVRGVGPRLMARLRGRVAVNVPPRR